MKIQKYYIFDCFGSLAGNINGYCTIRGATQQADSPKSKLNKYLWARADSYFVPAHQTTKLVYSIKLLGVDHE